MTIRHIAAISFFLLKTIYFSPAGNLSFWILLLIGGCLFAGGDLGKHEVVLLLLIIGISYRLMPAINNITLRHNNLSSSVLSNYAQLLPVENHVFFSAFMLSGAIYGGILISLCLYIGILCENPPVVEALTPPQTVMTQTSSGEPIATVEGIMMIHSFKSVSGPFLFKVPLHSSMIYSILASDIIIDYHKVPDSVFQKFRPVSLNTQPDTGIFNYTSDKASPSKYYSTFLQNLNSIHLRRMIILSLFIFIFIQIDAIRKYWGKNHNSIIIFKWIDFVCYALYISLCLILILDILLPESIIKYISMLMILYKVPVSIFFNTFLLAAAFRILYSILPKRKHY